MVQTIQKRFSVISKELIYSNSRDLKDYHRYSNITVQRGQEVSGTDSNRVTSMLGKTRKNAFRGSQKIFAATHPIKLVYSAYPSSWKEISESIKTTYFLPVSKKTNFSNKINDIFIEDLEMTIDRINGSVEDAEEDEYGEIIIPTKYAIQKAIELVSKAANLIPKRFFKAWVSTEDSGGVGLDWSKPELEKEVRLVIPATPDRKICLYHEMGNEYGVEYNVSAKTLSYWLNWCNPK
jgi:hypothetical protein